MFLAYSLSQYSRQYDKLNYIRKISRENIAIKEKNLAILSTGLIYFHTLQAVNLASFPPIPVHSSPSSSFFLLNLFFFFTDPPTFLQSFPLIFLGLIT